MVFLKDKPIAGYGKGGFKANYMNYQAKYFEEHPNSKFSMLAGITDRPFNEYIGLIVNYGFTGFVLFLSILYLLIKAYKENSSKTTVI
jgi:O-antigen ligase